MDQRSAPSIEKTFQGFTDKLDHYEINDEKLEDILKSKEISDELYKGCEATTKTDARKLFVEKLADIAKNYPHESSPNQTITMKEFLGKEGLKLYQQAIQEEYESREFRKAVFLASTKFFAGPSWKQKMILWIGGPSASGKSFARDGLVNAVSYQLEKNDDTNGNFVVSVDGGVEREMSQIRQLLLQTALSKGYKGIQDLEKRTKPKNNKKKSIKIKSYIEKAAAKHQRLHLAIPATFTNLALGRIRKYAKLSNVQQIFSRIIGGKTPADNARFQKTVERLGNERAWYKGLFEKITMNNRQIGCESKKYVAKHFKSGVRCSALARHIYRLSQAKYGKKILDFTVSNDLIFLRNVDNKGQWQSCEPTYHGEDVVVRISERGFDAWQNVKDQHPDLVTWWDANKRDDRYSEAIVDQDLKRASAIEELQKHPFFLAHQHDNFSEIKNISLQLLAHLQLAYENEQPEILRKLGLAIERILGSGKHKKDDLLFLCDELYLQLIHDKQINPEIIQSLKNQCKISGPVNIEESLESKEKSINTNSFSATQRIQLQLDQQEIQKNLSAKLNELNNRFGIITFQKEDYPKLGLEKEILQKDISTIYKVEKGEAKGIILAETENNKNYKMYSIKSAKGDAIYEQAYIMLKLFVAKRGSKDPVFLLTNDPDLKQALAIIGKGNELNLKDSQGENILFDNKADDQIKHLQSLHPEYFDLNAQKAAKIDRSIREWIVRVDEMLPLDKLNNLEKLLNAESQLKSNLSTGTTLSTNLTLSGADRALVESKLLGIQKKLSSVETEIKKIELNDKPTPVLESRSGAKRWFKF